jgi:hypothetical protein
MQIAFKAIEGQSITDVVLNTYGTVNQLGRLIVDNGIADINGVTTTGQQFVFDSQYIEDQNLYDYIIQYDAKFRTGIGLGRFLITEDGQFILTEDGRYIIVD